MIFPAARNEYLKRTISDMSKEELIYFYFNETQSDIEQKICETVLEIEYNTSIKDLRKKYPEHFL